MQPFQAKWQFTFLKLHAKLDAIFSKVVDPFASMVDHNTKLFQERARNLRIAK